MDGTKLTWPVYLVIIIACAVIGSKINNAVEKANNAYDYAADAYYEARAASERVDQACYILNNGC